MFQCLWLLFEEYVSVGSGTKIAGILVALGTSYHGLDKRGGGNGELVNSKSVSEVELSEYGSGLEVHGNKRKFKNVLAKKASGVECLQQSGGDFK